MKICLITQVVEGLRRATRAGCWSMPAATWFAPAVPSVCCQKNSRVGKTSIAPFVAGAHRASLSRCMTDCVPVGGNARNARRSDGCNTGRTIHTRLSPRWRQRLRCQQEGEGAQTSFARRYLELAAGCQCDRSQRSRPGWRPSAGGLGFGETSQHSDPLCG